MLFETTIKNLAEVFGETIHDCYKRNEKWSDLNEMAARKEFDFDFCLSPDNGGETWFGVKAIKDEFDGDQVVLTCGEWGIGIASVFRLFDPDVEYAEYDFKNMIFDATDRMGYGSYYDDSVIYIDYPEEKEN